MISNPVSIDDSATLDELDALFFDHGFRGVPVTGANGQLLGIVQRLAVENARSRQERSDYLKEPRYRWRRGSAEPSAVGPFSSSAIVAQRQHPVEYFWQQV